jgi:hypothetical protein
VARISLDAIVGRLVPFVLVIVGCVMVITYVPAISLTLRDLVYPPPAVSVMPSPSPSPSPAPR